MAKFRFKLEPLLRQRRALEEMRQRELADHLQQRTTLHDQLRGMQQTIGDSKRDLRDGLRGQVDLDRVALFARYSGQVTQRAHQMVVRLSGIERQIETARNKLLESTRARRALEMLRERHFEQWQREQDRCEEAELDDLALQRYMRSQVVLQARNRS